jgi:hypothetical protein
MRRSALRNFTALFLVSSASGKILLLRRLMIKTITATGRRFERFLNIDPSFGAADRIRARIIYGTGLIGLCLQLINMFSMSVVYGGWTSQHNIATISCAVFLSLTLALR